MAFGVFLPAPRRVPPRVARRVSSFTSQGCRLSRRASCTRRARATPSRRAAPPACTTSSGDNGESEDMWQQALEELFLETLRTYYQDNPMLTDSEFQTLRDELEHLGANQLRLDRMEKVWVQATSSRDFDRRVREEFEISEEELRALKTRLLEAGIVQRAVKSADVRHAREQRDRGDEEQEEAADGDDDIRLLNGASDKCNDARRIDADAKMNERLKWLIFTDASEERFKIMLLYLPAVLMSLVTASVFTILFALLDGEMSITVTAAGRFRLGILSYLVVMMTVWFSNQVTPVMLDYLDLGQPSLLRGECPICEAPISCLFTGAARNRDERTCGMCGCTIGFNRRWSKIYLVSQPSNNKYEAPD